MVEVAVVKVHLDKARSYPILIGQDLLSSAAWQLKKLGLKGKVLILTNTTVAKFYGKKLEQVLKQNYTCLTYAVPDGEVYKNLSTVQKIYDFLLKNKYDRQTIIVALGGGVVGDMAGYVAGTYLRGVSFVQVPTTLLAQVDSSVGGKTGVNHPLGKNMIGVFYQPKLVLIDLNVLSTLPEREFLSGLAEVIKYGLIYDRRFYKYLGQFSREKVRDLQKIIKRCCEIKASVVAKDEKEYGLRAILNFGHTVGHALEAYTNYKKFTHGEGVALGMVAAMQLSIDKKYITSDELQRLLMLYRRVGLLEKTDIKFNLKKIIALMLQDKKVKNGQINFVLIKKIGKAVVEPISQELIQKVMLLI